MTIFVKRIIITLNKIELFDDIKNNSLHLLNDKNVVT